MFFRKLFLDKFFKFKNKTYLCASKKTTNQKFTPTKNSTIIPTLKSNQIIKQLLITAAVAAMAFSANAETNVLWGTDVPEGIRATWDTPLLQLNAEQASEINAGDVLTMTVVSADTEGWPQVALFDPNVGWPPMSNVGVGGQTYPFIASFPVTNAMAETFHANGVAFKGDGAFVTEIGQVKGPGYLDPNAVWFGKETLAWGKAISIPNSVFENVKAGDKIQVKYDKEAPEHTLQIILGGWNGLNLATYEAAAHEFMTVDEESGVITIELTEALADYVWSDNTWDAFKLLKEGGLVMQGPCTVLEVLYIPYVEIPTTNFYAVGGFQGWNVEEPAVFSYANGVYTLVAEKASTMKISTLAGDWDSFNSATIGLSVAEVEFEDGSLPYTVTADYEFVLDYEATWTVTINAEQNSIKFTTDDPKPATPDIYLRGGMNNWEAVDSWKFVTSDDIVFTLSDVTLEKGTQFKVADANWGTINYGTNAAITLEEPVVLYYNGQNCSVAETVENINVIFNLNDKTLKLTKSSAIESISNENVEAVYYNLQGIQVNRPIEGSVYIVKKGSKVSKIAF